MVTVICTGGEAPPPARCLPWLRKCQVIIAADGGLAFLKEQGIKADLWVGDGDSLGSPVESWDSWFAQKIVLATDKDDSDTEAAVKLALTSGCKEIWLLGGGGRRMDHWMSNLRLVETCNLISRWMTANEEIRLLNAGEEHFLALGIVSIFPVGPGPWSIRSQGLRWPLDQLDFTTNHSLSNLVIEAPGKLNVIMGRFLILIPFPEVDLK